MTKVKRYEEALRQIARHGRHTGACFGGTRFTATQKRVPGPEGRDHCACPIKIAKDALCGGPRLCQCLGCILIRKDKAKKRQDMA